MTKKTRNPHKGTNMSHKPKHSLDVNRANKEGAGGTSRSAATVRRLKMYRDRAKRDKNGKVLYQVRSGSVIDFESF